MGIIHRATNTKLHLELCMSDDRLKLFATVQPQPESVTLTNDDLLREIQAVCPLDLIAIDIVHDIVSKLRQGEKCEERRVAKGTAPLCGRDGKIVWLVRRFKAERDHEEKDRGFADFFHLGLFENVRKGQEIARLYKPKSGKPGRDVMGKPLAAAAGKAAICKLDKSVVLKNLNRPDGYDVLVSDVDGYVREESGSIFVKDTLEIPEHLDYSIGHVDFIGNVVVRGDVHKGFNVRAHGSIEIRGSVFGENVIASDSSVIVKGFHQGGEKAVVYAKAGYSVSVAHHVRAEIRGDIIVLKEALDCALRTNTIVSAPKAILQGGTTWSVGGVEVKTLGNEAGITTEVEVRNELEVSEEFEDLQESIKKHQTALSALGLHLGPYAKSRARVALLNAPFRDKILTMLQKYDHVRVSLHALEVRLLAMRGGPKPVAEARINVLQTLNAGVSLSANEAIFECKEPVLGPVSFAVSDDGTEWRKVEFVSMIKKERS